ncbi:MAG: MoxR family ATPase [Deltaproteobacteria bacterium]|nr:MoxR family ATPase [Deltaproteobacteria bacterium]MBW2415996.1 MoxR family ATPase [Deltaproteobacteria bacterium]
MHERLKPLRELLDERIVGHDDAKQALLLALVCREHLYLEGPPGAAKTLMAELAARGSALRFFFYQFHRDTRLAELLGDVVLERETLPARDGEAGEVERIRQRIEPGGLLTGEVCVLDDLSRAPGEALNVLLRILNERRYGDLELPLLSAIATGNPTGDDYYNEPLDPANLDRFALQLRVRGLLQSGDADASRRLVEHFAANPGGDEPPGEAVAERAAFDDLYRALPGVAVPPGVVDALLGVLRALVEEHGLREDNSLLTDRTFLVKALKLLRGRALLHGRKTVVPEDLAVLEWMTTFRVPEEVHARVPELIRLAAG